VSAKLPGGSEESSVMTDNMFSYINRRAANSGFRIIEVSVEIIIFTDKLKNF
jgi:hypothetical protein